jgi:malate permease and related proteins
LIVNIINQVIILTIIMFVGVYARKVNIINKETKRNLSDFLINISLPLLIFSSFNYTYSAEMFEKAKLIFIYSVIIHILLIIISNPLSLKFPNNIKKVLRFVIIFSNCGFMGYPVLEGLFGKIGVFYGAIFNVPFNIFMLGYGVMLFKGEKDIKALKKVLIHPGIIATVLGLLMFVFSIKLPYPLYMAVSTVGSMTTPLSMIIVGTMLAEIKFKEVFTGLVVYYASAIRLLVVPFIILVVMKHLKIDQQLMQISVIIEAMPAAVMATVFAEKYGADTMLASKCVFISTMISMITIPLIVLAF